ncbi:MAG: PhnD/SsuA/transferrin family substrate-binding protein [Sedimenticola sp.]
MLVHASTGINDLASLKGEWISFVSKRSWPGYRLPLALLEKEGIDESSNNFYFVGNHVGAVSALLHRDVHVAVMAEPLARRWAEQNGLSIVAVTDEVETGGWWLHRDVAGELANNCTQALTGIGRSRYKALPSWLGSFVTPSTER